MLFIGKFWELFSTNHINKIYEKYYFPDDEDIYNKALKIKKEFIRYFIYERVKIKYFFILE